MLAAPVRGEQKGSVYHDCQDESFLSYVLQIIGRSKNEYLSLVFLLIIYLFAYTFKDFKTLFLFLTSKIA
jgi:hypothetical protein